MRPKPYSHVSESQIYADYWRVILFSGKRKQPGQFIMDGDRPKLFPSKTKAKAAGKAALEAMNV